MFGDFSKVSMFDEQDNSLKVNDSLNTKTDTVIARKKPVEETVIAV
jgi:hypothetical protein